MSRTITQIVFLPPLAVEAAHACGALERRDLDVHTIRTRSSGEQFQRLMDGSVDVAVTAIDNLFAWNQQAGADLRVIAQIERITPSPVFVRCGLADLAGVAALDHPRLLVDAPDSGFVLALRAILEDVGVARDGYSLIPVGGPPERFAALAEGRGDAAMLAPQFANQARAAGIVQAGTLEDFYPDFLGLGVVARATAVESVSSVANLYREAVAEALAWIDEDPARASVLLAGQESIASDLPVRAQSTIVSRRGFERLVAIRRSLEMLPAGKFGYDDLVDPAVRA